MSKKPQELSKEVLIGLTRDTARKFNWEKVRIVMSVLNWRWVSLASARIPHIEDLKRHAKDKLQDLYNHKDYKTLSGGGLEAYRFDGEQYKSELGLRFCIEEIDIEFRINKKDII